MSYIKIKKEDVLRLGSFFRLPAAVCPGSPEPQREFTTSHAEFADFEVVNSVTL